MIDVVYLCAGSGFRANLGYPKQFAYLGGKPLLMHGLEILNSIDVIQNIIIPSPESDIEKVEEIINSFNIKKKIKIIKGGKTRQESVFKSLDYVNTEDVLIGEAVRPFVTKELIIKILQLEGNVIPYMKLNSTPFDRQSGNILSRDRIVQVQTPQKYITNELKDSHKFANKQGLINTTDDLDLMKKIGICGVYTYIEGPTENIKITYPLDIVIADGIYKYKNYLQRDN